MNEDCAAYIRRVSSVTELVQDKWTLQILCAMRYKPVRHSQLQRLIPSASKKALRASLRFLESMQIVVRFDLGAVLLHVEYDFAGDMREAVSSLLDRLAACGDLLEAKKATLVHLEPEHIEQHQHSKAVEHRPAKQPPHAHTCGPGLDGDDDNTEAASATTNAEASHSSR